MALNFSIPASDTSRKYWVVLAVRAVIVLASGLTIVFSSDHSATVGFVVFGVAATASGVLCAGLTIKFLQHGPWRTLQVGQFALTTVAGVIALALASSGGTTALSMLLLVWAAATGVAELFTALVARRSLPFVRQWLSTAVFTMLLAVVIAIVPADFYIQYGGTQQISGGMTGSGMIVGIFSAYAVVIAVYLGIASLTHKWAFAALISGEADVVGGTK